MQIEKKLAILADAAKYDASCASSGSRRRPRKGQLGNAAASGICHTYTEDGRCVSLLKILLTNICIYDCAYCVNRSSNDVPRASFDPGEVVSLTLDFYRRNYIEGLFLSSGILQSPNATMERLVRVVSALRSAGFNGYIHLKCVPNADPLLIQAAGRHADRLSVNIELPSDESLRRLTQAKSHAAALAPMDVIRSTIAERKADHGRLRHVPAFAPAGQSTQLIVGASPESDHEILHLAGGLYQAQALKRVYYAAYVPVGKRNGALPQLETPPLRRENRLYQADWLIRCYGFALEEVIQSDRPFLDLEMDPKHAFALRNPSLFPVDINTAEREVILRVPGIGLRSARRIVALRRQGRIRLEHLRQMGVVLKRALPFIRCDGLPEPGWRGAALAQGDLFHRTGDAPPVTPPEAPLVLVCEDSFDGLLSAIFAAYRLRARSASRMPDAIVPLGRSQPELFERRKEIATDRASAVRVWRGLKSTLGRKGRRRLHLAYLSRDPGVETAIYRFVRDALADEPRRGDLGNRLTIRQLARKVGREAHRMKGLVRFAQNADGSYQALIAPRYDVLPLIRHHFERRFADQRWLIYDTGRRYGLLYDGWRTRDVRLEPIDPAEHETACPSDERRCQQLWQRYYAAVNIAARNNPKLHRQQLPRRYWPYLTEKKA